MEKIGTKSFSAKVIDASVNQLSLFSQTVYYFSLAPVQLLAQTADLIKDYLRDMESGKYLL